MIKNRKKLFSLFIAVVASSFVLCACGEDDNSDRLARRQYGINCLNEGKYDQAIDAFQTILVNSKNGINNLEEDVCLYKAKAQYLGGYSKDAIETYSALIDYNKNPAAYYGRGCIYFDMQEYDKGFADFDKAIEKDSKDYDLYIGIYNILSQNGYEEKGAGYLSKALEIGGKSAKDKMEKGRIYILQGKTADAIEILQKAIDDGESKAYYYMGQAYSVDGNTELAVQYFEQYIESGDASADELMAVGETQLKQGNYATALTYFESAQNMETGVSNLQQLKKDMIICYEKQLDFANAKSLMEQYVKDYPDDEEAGREYIFLKNR